MCMVLNCLNCSLSAFLVRGWVSKSTDCPNRNIMSFTRNCSIQEKVQWLRNHKSTLMVKYLFWQRKHVRRGGKKNHFHNGSQQLHRWLSDKNSWPWNSSLYQIRGISSCIAQRSACIYLHGGTGRGPWEERRWGDHPYTDCTGAEGKLAGKKATA